MYITIELNVIDPNATKEECVTFIASSLIYFLTLA